MKEEWLKLYEMMLREMEDCRKRGADPKGVIECSFNISSGYWARIQITMEDYEFHSKKDEIDFYKLVKPLFKSHIEYYNLLYQAEIFKPDNKPYEMKEFWIKEKQKLGRFIQDNAVFYVYYKNGATNRDEEYFLSGATESETGKTLYTDDLIAKLLALERYVQHAQNELSKL
jgi:hypothetical protein